MDKKKRIIEKDVWKARGQELIEKNVLDETLLPRNLIYSVVDKTIIIKQKELERPNVVYKIAQQSITGTVTDSLGGSFQIIG